MFPLGIGYQVQTRGRGRLLFGGTMLDTDIKENQNTLLSLHELLYPLITQRCKRHKVLLIIYTTTLAFLLVEKHDLNLLYKYSKNEKRTLMADGVWSVLIHSAEGAG